MMFFGDSHEDVKCVFCALLVCVFVMGSPETEHHAASETRSLTEKEWASKYWQSVTSHFTGSDLTKPWRTVKKLKIAWACIPVSLLRHSRHRAVLTEEKNYAVLTLALEMEMSSSCKRYVMFVLCCRHICAATKCLTSNTTTNYFSYVKVCNYVWFLAVNVGLV